VEKAPAFGGGSPLGPGFAIYCPILWRVSSRGGHLPLDGTGRLGTRQNAMAESFVSTLKAKMGSLLLPTREATRMAIFDYIEGFYNPTRRHSSIGYMSPADYERAIAEEVRVA